ncbi:MAG: hypothetical protein P1P88_00460 [Bacteroidales bacterium]|nr:hypothetical protein [Bacteroidales bacterium]
MQIDFHYATIRIIAEKAGFSAEDSQIIAYASQYVDDAVDHKEINVDGYLDILSRRFTGNTFNPVCTAHRGLQFLKAFNEDVQQKIYIPFHFLPDLDEGAGFIVKENGKLSGKFVQSAIVELSKSQGERRIMNLIRLGITLHTYADSWAHQGFSGRHKPGENDIDAIEILRRGKWEKIGMISQFEYNTLPDIGHAEAASFPDQSHLKWRFLRKSDNKVYERDNTQLFLDAAEKIMLMFKGVDPIKLWPQTKTKLYECYSYQADSMEDKFMKFQRVFPEIGFYYDANQWRNEALRTIERKKILKVIKEEEKHFVLGSDKKWFYFHLAALEQREFVLELLDKHKG